MFKWYADSSLCIAFLADVDLLSKEYTSEFGESQWFRRGWTLQELLAPNLLSFYDKRWSRLGGKQDLAKAIANTTNIPVDCLMDRQNVNTMSVAAKMRWAANRRTSRVEDEAYCLLGLFNVNLPLLYGEAHRAFRRLQEAIIDQSADETIFAHTHWATPLAAHAADFMVPSRVSSRMSRDFFGTALGSAPFSVTNKGITMHAAFVDKKKESDVSVIALRSTCEMSGLPWLLPFLKRAGNSWEVIEYGAYHYGTLALAALSEAEVYLKTYLQAKEENTEGEAGEPPKPLTYDSIILASRGAL